MNRDDLVVLAKIAKPHGLRGELSVLLYAEDPAVFGELPFVYLAGDGKKRKLHPRKWRFNRDRLLLSFKELDGRDKVEGLRGMDICARRKDLPDSDSDEWYLHDIVGMSVRLEDGTELGKIEDFILTGESEVWIVRDGSGREIMLPAAGEFVLEVDMDREILVVTPPEGLLELYEE